MDFLPICFMPEFHFLLPHQMKRFNFKQNSLIIIKTQYLQGLNNVINFDPNGVTLNAVLLDSNWRSIINRSNNSFSKSYGSGYNPAASAYIPGYYGGVDYIPNGQSSTTVTTLIENLTSDGQATVSQMMNSSPIVNLAWKASTGQLTVSSSEIASTDDGIQFSWRIWSL